MVEWSEPKEDNVAPKQQTKLPDYINQTLGGINEWAKECGITKVVIEDGKCLLFPKKN